MSDRNRSRAEWYARAEYFAWEARRGITALSVPLGNDPIGGQPWQKWDAKARRLGYVSNRALAVESYRIARSFPSPLPAKPIDATATAWGTVAVAPRDLRRHLGRERQWSQLAAWLLTEEADRFTDDAIEGRLLAYEADELLADYEIPATTESRKRLAVLIDTTHDERAA